MDKTITEIRHPYLTLRMMTAFDETENIAAFDDPDQLGVVCEYHGDCIVWSASDSRQRLIERLFRAYCPLRQLTHIFCWNQCRNSGVEQGGADHPMVAAKEMATNAGQTP